MSNLLELKIYPVPVALQAIITGNEGAIEVLYSETYTLSHLIRPIEASF